MSKLVKAIAISVCILFGGLVKPSVVCAETANVRVEPRMTYISSYSTELSISSDGVATITGFVRGKSGVTSTYVQVILQKNVSGAWTDVESWEDTSTSISASVAETYQVSKGTYRVTMTCSANGETKTTTSAERIY